MLRSSLLAGVALSLSLGSAVARGDTEACCLPDGVCMNVEVGSPICGLIGGVPLGAGTSCVNGDCLGACCLPETGQCVASMWYLNCYLFGGQWAGPGSDCSGDCEQMQLGVCCLEDATCEPTNRFTCEMLIGGSWDPSFQECFEGLCGPGGACCLPDGGCLELDSSVLCHVTGGLWLTESVCEQVACSAFGACCMPAPAGCSAFTTEAECTAAGGLFLGAGSDCESVACSCAGDLNGDGLLGFDDLSAVFSMWGPCTGCIEDLTGDGVVGLDDSIFILSMWGPCPQ